MAGENGEQDYIADQDTVHPHTIGSEKEPLDRGLDQYDVDDGGSQEPSVDEKLAALEAKIEEQDRLRTQEREFYQNMLAARMGQQGQDGQDQGQDQGAAGISFDDLPDPVDKPEEFRKGLSQKFNSAMEQERERIQQSVNHQTSNAQALDRMWNTFKQRYPDLAEKEALVSGVTNMEAQRIRAQGGDVPSVVMADPDGFMERIAGRMKQELGISDNDNGQQEGNHGQNGRQGGGAGRTRGVSSGTRQQGRPRGGEQPRPFMDQLKKTQLDSGLI